MKRTTALHVLALGMLLSVMGLATADDNPTRKDKLPMTNDWNIDLIKELGTIVSIRDETKENNRVVFVVEMKSVATPHLAAKYFDSKEARGFEQVYYKTLKKDNPGDKTTKVEVSVALPKPEVQKVIRKVVIEKTAAPLKKE